MNAIPEKDWKLLKSRKEEKLNVACDEILVEVSLIIASKGKDDHKAYLEVWDKVQSGNIAIANMFNDLRRSNAVLKLATWKRNGLLTEKELSEFSEETRLRIKGIVGE